MGRAPSSKKKKPAARCWASASARAGPQEAAGRMAGRGLFKHSDSFYFLFYFQKHLNNCFAQF